MIVRSTGRKVAPEGGSYFGWRSGTIQSMHVPFQSSRQRRKHVAKSRQGESRVNSYLLAMLTAALTFVGAGGGTYLGHRLEQRRQERDLDHEWKQHMLQRRLELVDKAVRIINQASAAMMLQGVSQTIAMEGTPAEVENGQISVRLERSLKLRMELAALNAEFGSVMSLANIYFGPKTRAATKALTKYPEGWWNAPGYLQQAVLNAMEGEMTEPPLDDMKRKE